MDSLRLEIKQFLIEALDLDDMTPDDIPDDAPLFSTDGVGLDSIDALEIGILLRKKYQLTLLADDGRMQEHFRSVATLADLVQRQRGSASDAGGTAAQAERS